MTTLVEKSKEFGTRVHEETNHMYGDKPYSWHLSQVAVWVRKFGYLLTPEQQELAEAGAWVHDAIEDARQTYNDVKSELGEEVAEVAYALTNSKGRNRAERADNAYYAGIRDNHVAHFVKICDRLANASESASTGSRMKKMYLRELPHFKSKLEKEEFQDMWDKLDSILRS